MSQSRVPRGVFTGGRYAPDERPEAGVGLVDRPEAATVNAAVSVPARALSPGTTVMVETPFGPKIAMLVLSAPERVSGRHSVTARLEDTETGLIAEWDFGGSEDVEVLLGDDTRSCVDCSGVYVGDQCQSDPCREHRYADDLEHYAESMHHE